MFFDNSRPDRQKRANKQVSVAERLQRLASSPVPPPKPYTLFGLDEVLHSTFDRTGIFDVESYPNYWLVAFKCIASKKIIYFEDTPSGYFINGYAVEFAVWQNYLVFILYRWRIIGFNSRSYDIPMCLVASQGVRAEKLNQVSNEIILQDMQPYEIERKYAVKAGPINHIDIIEVAPIQASLKIYAGRLHCERMQDLPYPVGSHLTVQQAFHVRDYCINDLDNTEMLFNHIEPFIVMREQLGQEYNQDLRSKSDAQIAEAIITSELDKIGVSGKKPTIDAGTSFHFNKPDFIEFQTPQFKHALEVVLATPFIVGNGGSALCPQEIADLKPQLGICTYRLGVGGLHSSEENVCHVADENTLIIDRDVASFYPYIILNGRLFPTHLGEGFLEVYRNIVMRRLKLKKEKNPLEAGLKIAINGTFGKLGNLYSKMYAPDLLTQVTMTGQLSLMMLIEMIELAGIPVVSANTDGVVIKCPVNRYQDLENVITVWEGKTGFVTEETRYKGIYNRDVNNYIAIGTDGKVKTKGVYCERGSAQNSVLSKNPEYLICSEAVQQFLANGVPIKQTIYDTKDIRKFVSVRTVKGGAEKNGVYLGKAVRWYYAKDEVGTINYAISGNKVPKSEGAKPLMLLPEQLPYDLDFDWYINQAEDILFEIGYYQREKPRKLL